MIKKIILFVLIVFAIKGCTKDDICPEGTAITANLLISFNDIANPLNTKEVTVLSVLTNNPDSIAVVNLATTASITIPLNTNSDTTKYLFKKSTLAENGTVLSENIDKVMFIYQRRNGYVNRACGFNTEFFNLETNLEPEGNANWIQEIIVKRDTVNDENSDHITMLH